LSHLTLIKGGLFVALRGTPAKFHSKIWVILALGVVILAGVAIFFILPVAGITTLAAQEPDTPIPYDDPDAYQIYSLLIPHEESYEFGKGTIVIREETVSGPMQTDDPGRCISDQAMALTAAI
jgi:hypothetical protein